MSNGIEIRSNEGNYETRAHSFTMANDLYLFFRFESPESDAEIGIAYDEFVDGGDWFVNDGNLSVNDFGIVGDVIWDKLPSTPEFTDFETAVDAAMRRFNGLR